MTPTLPICPSCDEEKEGSFLLDGAGRLVCKPCREGVDRGLTTAAGTSPTRVPLGSSSRLDPVGRTLRSLAAAMGLVTTGVRPAPITRIP